MTDFRLSPQQRSQWNAARADWDRSRRFQALVAIEGLLDADALEQALARVVARHEVLRTTFHTLPGMSLPVQRIHPERAVALERHDLDGLDEAARARALDARFDEIGRRPIALDGGPAVQASLVRVSERAHALLVSLSALTADARSLDVFVAELAGCYAEAKGAREPPEPAVQYADVAEVFNHLLEASDTEAGRAYWRSRANLGAERAALPFELTRDDAEAPSGVASVRWEIDGGLAARLNGLVARTGAPLAVVLAGLFQRVLGRSTGVPEVGVDVRVPARSYEGLDGAIGAFERYVPLACPVDEASTFGAHVTRLAAAAAEGLEHQDFLEPTQASDARGADLGFAFSFDERPAATVAAGVSFSLGRMAGASAPFKLALACTRHDGALRAEIAYDASVLTAADAARVAGRMEALARDAFEREDAALAELSVTSADDHAFFARHAASVREVPRDVTVHALFEDQVRRTPDAVAVICGDERLTFEALDARANQLALCLLALDVGPEACVGLCLDRSVASLVGVLGILKAGAAYVPLDPAYPRERLAFMVEEAGVRVIVTQRDLCGALPEGPVYLCVDASRELDDARRDDPREPRAAVSASSLAYVLYTSGSTGKPKGVMVEHRSVVNLAAALDEAIYEGHAAGLVVTMNAPLAFDASVKQWVQLLRGHTVCVVPETARLDPRQMLALLARHRVDVLDCTPSQLRLLLAAGLASAPPGRVLVGGEAIDAATWARLGEIPQAAFFNVYGPTECTVDATAARVLPGTAPSIGRPLANVSVHVLDASGLRVPPGAPGELYVGGAGVARGYLNRPDRTAERFVRDPFGGPGDRLYRTGDLVRHTEGGALAFLGRCDHQIKLRGFRMEAGEIEAVLLASPEVAETVVVVRDVALGPAEDAAQPHLVAYVVPRPPATEVSAELRARLRRELPEYMVPSLFVALPRLPVTRNGKVDRAALPAPDARATSGPETTYEAPGNDVERTIAAIWQEVLGVERVGVHHNFFDLGGHSLLMVQVYDKLCATFGKRFPLVELFRQPTVGDLARYLGRAAEAEAPSFDAVEERARRQRQAMQRRQQKSRKDSGRR